MKINEINPGEKEELQLALPKILNLLESQCGQALQEMHKVRGFLYRGIKKAPLMFKGASRIDRKPLDTNETQHESFNKLVREYGFTVDRTNSLFCSGSPKMASGYGKEYMIFPLDGYEFLWSAKVKDMFGNFGLEDAIAMAAGKSNLMAAADNFVRTYQYSDSNFAAAIQSGHEIMLKGQYYAFRLDTYYVPMYKAIFSHEQEYGKE